MKRALIMALVMVLLIGAFAPACAAKSKAHKVKHGKMAVMCDVCKDGKHTDCVYWCGDHHMTPHEIQDFEIMEMRYSADDVEQMTQAEKNALTPWFKL